MRYPESSLPNRKGSSSNHPFSGVNSLGRASNFSGAKNVKLRWCNWTIELLKFSSEEIGCTDL